jgi:hypothetical protein
MRRVTSTAGQCSPKDKAIEISPLYQDERLQPELPDLMAHEAAHFLWPTHPRPFKDFLRAVGVAQGYTSACHPGSTVYLAVKLDHHPRLRLWRCPGCRGVMASDGIVTASCGQCDREWSPRFRLEPIHVSDLEPGARLLSKLLMPSEDIIRAGLRPAEEPRAADLEDEAIEESLAAAS